MLLIFGSKGALGTRGPLLILILLFSCSFCQIYCQTRLHSSRMRTARLLTISPSMQCSGGCLLQGGDCSQGGACSQGCLLLGGVCPWGMRCLFLEGVWLLLGGYPSMHWGRAPHVQNSWHTLLKILPCPKLHLRAVIKVFFSVIGAPYLENPGSTTDVSIFSMFFCNSLDSVILTSLQ